ncbi:MAG: glycosyltransferase family 1 protein [Phycisphaerales bacterium]|nr:glycosyltransferase family 1 protein [Phycisphaerales bacterium]
MRIGIHPTLKRHDGGIYQYSITILNALCDLSTSRDCAWEHEFVVFVHEPGDPVLRRLADSRWNIKPFRPPWARQPAINLDEWPDVDSPREQPDMRAWLEECGIDLMLYPSPHRLSFESGIPFVMAIHDLQHLLQPEFAEVSAGGEWQRREYVLRNAARSATMLIAESEVGREDILNAYGRYGVEADQVRTLPYLPNAAIDPQELNERRQRVRERFDLPDRYLFYPAQFWPHKNHVRLVEALGLLQRECDLVIPLVLTGSGTGEIRRRVVAEIEERLRALGLEDRVRMLGYVADEEVAGLYAGAEALVMPTFFGPTNIPLIEAWALDCPVLTSRIRGIVEQVGDAAVTVDPKNVEEIAAGIRRLWTDESLRRTLIERGRARLEAYTPGDFRMRLARIVDEATERVRRRGCRRTIGAASRGGV